MQVQDTNEGWKFLINGKEYAEAVIVGEKPIIVENNAILTLDEIEKREIERALKICFWKADVAAKRLGIGLATIYRKIKKYKLPEPREEHRKVADALRRTKQEFAHQDMDRSGASRIASTGPTP